MKGDPVKSAPFVLGLCFICNEPCHELSYCHQECSIAMAEERDKRKAKAKEIEREQEKGKVYKECQTANNKMESEF